MRPAWRRPGNIATCSVIRAPAESTRYTRGICRRSAVSWMRTIFSTVRGPQDPALTVGSFAITAHVLPCMRPIPVTTPSAASSGSSVPASSPSSTKSLPESKRRLIRSRTGSLFWVASLSRWRCGPPARALSRRSSAASANARLHAGFLGCATPDSGAIELAGKVASEVAGERLCDGAHRGDVDAGHGAEGVQRLERVLRADVAGGARSERTTPNTANRTVEAAYAGGERRDDIGNAEPTRVVHMEGHTIDWRRGGNQRAHRGDINRGCHADRVCDAHLDHTAGHQVGAQFDNPSRCDLALERTPEAHRHRNIDGARALAGERDDVRDLVERLVNASIDVAAVEGIGRSDGDQHIAYAVRERKLQAAEIGDEHAQPWQVILQSSENGGCIRQ